MLTGLRRTLTSAALSAGIAWLVGMHVPPAAAQLKPSDVVTSIKPVHSLVASVMQGVAMPQLIVQGTGSPHAYKLKPSEARLLSNAKLVFYVDDNYEAFLAQPLKGLAAKAKIVALMDQPGMTILKNRTGGAWDAHDHKHDQGRKPAATPPHDHGDHADANVHVWLDPTNAAAMVDAIVKNLSALDAANAAAYARNGETVKAELRALDAEISRSLAPLKGKPFVVFHDAYHYFEARYGLNAVGSVTLSPEHAPGARRLTELRARIRVAKAECLFREPQFKPAIAESIAKDTGARLGTLDSLGADLPAGPAMYASLLRQLAAGLEACLNR
ncbi:MAG: zinc ABC transporter substrate-binding protein [Alphaproteobacteria bacterium]